MLVQELSARVLSGKHKTQCLDHSNCRTCFVCETKRLGKLRGVRAIRLNTQSGRNKRCRKCEIVRLLNRRHVYYKSDPMRISKNRRANSFKKRIRKCIPKCSTTDSSDESTDDERGTQSLQSESLSSSKNDSDNEQSSSSLLPNTTQRKSKAASHQNATNEDNRSSSSDEFEESKLTLASYGTLKTVSDRTISTVPQPKTIGDKVKLTISEEQSHIFKSNAIHVLKQFKDRCCQFDNKVEKIKRLNLRKDIKSLETANNILLETINITKKCKVLLEDQCKKLEQLHQSWSKNFLPSDEESNADHNISSDDIGDDDVTHRDVDSEKEGEQKKTTVLDKDSKKSSKKEPSRSSKNDQHINKEPLTSDLDSNVIFFETEEKGRSHIIRTASHSLKATTMELYEAKKSISENNNSISSTLEDGKKKVSKKGSSVTGLSNEIHNIIQHDETMANNTTVSSPSKITSDDISNDIGKNDSNLTLTAAIKLGPTIRNNVEVSETEEKGRPHIIRTASHSLKATTMDLYEAKNSISENNNSISSTLEDGNKKVSKKGSSVTGLSNEIHNIIQHDETMANNTTVSSPSKITSDDISNDIGKNDSNLTLTAAIKLGPTIRNNVEVSETEGKGRPHIIRTASHSLKATTMDLYEAKKSISENNNSISSTLEDGNKKVSKKGSSVTGLSNEIHNIIQHDETMANNTTVSSPSKITSDDISNDIGKNDSNLTLTAAIKLGPTIPNDVEVSETEEKGRPHIIRAASHSLKATTMDLYEAKKSISENNNSISSTLEDGKKKVSKKGSSITGLSNEIRNTIQHDETMANNTTVSLPSKITSDDISNDIGKNDSNLTLTAAIKLGPTIPNDVEVSETEEKGRPHIIRTASHSLKATTMELYEAKKSISENNNSISSTLEDSNKKVSKKGSSITGLSNEIHNIIQHDETMANNTTVSSPSKITSDDIFNDIGESELGSKAKSKSDKFQIKAKLSDSTNSSAMDKAAKSKTNQKSVLDESSGPMVGEKLLSASNGSDSVEKSEEAINMSIKNIPPINKIPKNLSLAAFVSEIDRPKDTVESNFVFKIKKRKLNSDKDLQKEDKSDEEDEKDSSKSKLQQDKMLTIKFSDSKTELGKEREKMSEKRNNEASDEKEDIGKRKRHRSIYRKRVLLSDSDAKESKSSSDSGSSDNSGSTKKKQKKKKKRYVNNSSVADTSGGEKNKKRIKRRRIQQMDSDSDSEKSDGNDNRKWDNPKSSQDPEQAEKEEEERQKRIAEREKLYNKLYKQRLSAEETLEELVLDFNSETKQPLVSVHKEIVKHLKHHQAEGIRFMWNSCFESLERLKTSQGSGCIIAHCMGLGKTLQVISLVHTLLMHEQIGIQTVMIVTPLTTVLNWVNEIHKWLKDTGDADNIEVYELTEIKTDCKRMYEFKRWKRTGGMLIIGYHMFTNMVVNNENMHPDIRKNILKYLVNPGPDLVVCDEGHLLKNEYARLSMCMNRIKTRRRIVLTGTPLQNNLIEYYCMAQFVKPSSLGTKDSFIHNFVNPIIDGQYKDSSQNEVNQMKKRAHVLNQKLIGFVQRFDYSVLTPFLPPKQEYVISVSLSQVQIHLYQYYVDGVTRKFHSKTLPLFGIFHALQKIGSHPLALQYQKEKWEKRCKREFSKSESEESVKDIINSDCDYGTSSTSNCDGDEESEASIDETINTDGKTGKRYSNTCWWEQFVTPEHLEDMRVSGKLMLLFGILKECQKVGDKLLVFSQSLYTLNLIEFFLKKVDSNQSGHTCNWTLGRDYFRLDGRTSAENRNNMCEIFNKPGNTHALLFLISTKAGGLGINLTAANRVIIFDASWNPAHDTQSIFRIYRFGQKKPCYIYRFLAAGTIEEQIYNRQIIKLSLARRVLDEEQIGRHYTYNDLQVFRDHYCQLKTNLEGKKPILNLTKDRLLGNVFLKYKDYVENYHEHDSLLENKIEEELDEDEKKLAWLEYEKKKKESRAKNLKNQSDSTHANRPPYPIDPNSS